MPDSTQPTPKPQKPRPDFPLTAHPNGTWCKKVKGEILYFGPWADPAAAERRYRGFLATGVRPEKTARAGRRRKPRKSRGFPLTAHPNGQWCKKVRGVVRFFGVWADPEAALNLWLEQKDDLLAGREPRGITGDGLTIRDLCNQFCKAKRQKVDEGALTLRSWQDYFDTCERVLSVFGKNRRVDDLRPVDFQKLRAHLATGRGPETLGNDIQRARTLFKYAYDMRLIDRPADFGPEFKRPSKQVRRKARQARPRKLFTADEIRRLIGIASTQMKAMILLGINCGLGNGDCAALTKRHLDLQRGTLEYPRPKTSVERRATLWPETIKAIEAALAIRPEPKDPVHADLVFVTKYGGPWVHYRLTAGGVSNVNAITREFEKLMRKLGIRREGVNFYALRHTTETIGSQAGDLAALDRIMGHEGSDMGTHYREWIGDEAEDTRLRKVTEHVRTWLYARPKETLKLVANEVA